jgi:hypothetical protein
VKVQKVYPLEQASTAMTDFKAGTPGKLVITTG